MEDEPCLSIEEDIYTQEVCWWLSGKVPSRHPTVRDSIETLRHS